QSLKKKILWLGLWALALSIASQYHFFALFSLAAISAVFFFVINDLWNPKQIVSSCKKILTRQFAVYILAVFVIFGVTYTPVIISDVVTHGSNTKNFIGAFSEKPRKNKTLRQKIIRNLREQPKHYYLLITSFRHQHGKKADPVPVGFGAAFVVLGIVLAVIKRRKEKIEVKRNFLTLVIIWTAVFFLVTIPMSYQLRPRFFVVIFPIPYIFFALWFSFFKEKLKKRSYPIIFSVVASILFLNFYGTYAWFREQQLSQNNGFEVGRTYILKRQDGITLGQLERAIDHMYSTRRTDDILFYADTEYINSVKYLFQLKNDAVITYEPVKNPQSLRNREYIFALNNTKGGVSSLSKKVKAYAVIVSEKQFGQLIVYEMRVDQESLPKLENEAVASEDKKKGKTKRIFWRDIFNMSDDELDIELGKKE
ncbi:MAG: hypothetical protein U9M90_01340, partial [Patescibacteria group bacterium]|nr:hypothetical protein [Patescibacteria group bacterium]